MQHYHYIFTGSGLAALMTVYEMILSNSIEGKSILLIDSNTKKNNDRTWCFWDETDLFDEISSKKWDQAIFADRQSSKTLELHPYRYKMIRGLDFYKYIFDLIANYENIEILNQRVVDFSELGQHCIVKTENSTFSCNQVFNSIYKPYWVNSQKKYPLLQQHFIGWFIKTEEAIFNSETLHFMDFSIDQKKNTRFMYLLPTSSQEALLEYTLFSADLLPKKEYEQEIENYIKKLGISSYKIIEKEDGNIPMTSYKFWNNNSKNIIHIGSAGGWTKASTGFTFKNTTKKAKELVEFLSKETDFRKFHKINRFWFYDLLFIDVLHTQNDLGSTVFSSLFKTKDYLLIFKFLDEETTFWEELKLIWNCPKALFLKALIKRVLRFN